MLTVSKLAKTCNLARTTILYYEKEGLLKPDHVTSNGYRWYGEKEVDRLKTITAYRSYGLSIANIQRLLEHSSTSQFHILESHFRSLETEINHLRTQQKAIIGLLKDTVLSEGEIMNKARWVEIMMAAGLSKEDMITWHQKFEAMEPEEHQKFLESLGISQDEIAKIRAL